MIDIKIPTIGESITEVTLLKWVKKEGEWVDRDEEIAELHQIIQHFNRRSIWGQ